VYPPKKLALYPVGLIVLIFGIVLFIVGFVDDQQKGQTLQSSQTAMGSVLIVIL
jgi:hypothetical protein